MHPRVVYPGELKPLLESLQRPLDEGFLRNLERHPDSCEVSLEHGFRIESSSFSDEPRCASLLEGFQQFLCNSLGSQEAADGFPVRLHRRFPTGCPPDAPEAYRVEVNRDGCEISAANFGSLQRALFFLQDEMRMRRAPILPLLRPLTRWTSIGTRISRCPIAPYRWLSGWELGDDNDYYPDAYLHRLAHSGVNGLWVPGLLRNLVASKILPELGPKEHQLGKLNRLIEKAARHGIRIYLFCVEPRALPPGHPAAKAYPEILGAPGRLCLSEPRLLEYIRETMRTLFTEASGLAGLINIFNSERPTNCWQTPELVAECPRCNIREQADVLGAALTAFQEGIHAANPRAEFMAWTYMMDPKTNSLTTLPIEPMLRVMRRTDPRVIWLGNFEHGSTKELCGRTMELHEYSLSCIGPATNFTDLAGEARTSGRRIYGKLQMATSFEMPSIPEIPVPGIVHDKMARLSEHGGSGAMLGWIPGGFPGPVLKAACEAAFEPRPSKEHFLQRLAAIDWGEEASSSVAAAWQLFETAWQLYPFNNAVLYFGPVTRAPAYPLRLEQETREAKPYNWGLDRERNRQPFPDRVERWLGPYRVEEITGSFREMARLWEEGLRLLPAPCTPAQREQAARATALRLQCLVTANVYEFYAVRDKLLEAPIAEHASLVARLKAIAEEELGHTREMIPLLKADPALGYMPEIYTYSYSTALLNEREHQLTEVLKTLSLWETSGVEESILRDTVAQVEFRRPDYHPDFWGD